MKQPYPDEGSSDPPDDANGGPPAAVRIRRHWQTVCASVAGLGTLLGSAALDSVPGQAVAVAELTVVLVTWLTALFGTERHSYRAFRLLGIPVDKPEPTSRKKRAARSKGTGKSSPRRAVGARAVAEPVAITGDPVPGQGDPARCQRPDPQPEAAAVAGDALPAGVELPRQPGAGLAQPGRYFTDRSARSSGTGSQSPASSAGVW
jgi:hypothetical protein